MTGLAFAAVAAYAVTLAAWLTYRLVLSRKVEAELRQELAKFADLDARVRALNGSISDLGGEVKKRIERLEFKRVA